VCVYVCVRVRSMRVCVLYDCDGENTVQMLASLPMYSACLSVYIYIHIYILSVHSV